jgi:DNA-binding transcriptional LysR family regulator
VVLHSMNKSEQIEALRQRRINLGFNRVLTPLSDITSELVTTESLLLAISADHPLARLAVVPFAALAEHPLVLFPTGSRPSFIDRVIGLCQQVGFVPQISQEVGDVVSAVALVAHGFGACLVAESTSVLALPGVVYRPLSGLPESARIDLSCIYRSDDHSPILASLLQVVREFRSRHAPQD